LVACEKRLEDFRTASRLDRRVARCEAACTTHRIFQAAGEGTLSSMAAGVGPDTHATQSYGEFLGDWARTHPIRAAICLLILVPLVFVLVIFGFAGLNELLSL
jgi:hypothetical protein